MSAGSVPATAGVCGLCRPQATARGRRLCCRCPSGCGFQPPLAALKCSPRKHRDGTSSHPELHLTHATPTDPPLRPWQDFGLLLGSGAPARVSAPPERSISQASAPMAWPRTHWHALLPKVEQLIRGGVLGSSPLASICDCLEIGPVMASDGFAAQFAQDGHGDCAIAGW